MTFSGVAVRPRAVVQVAHYPPSSTFGPRRLLNYEFVWLLSGSARWLLEELDEAQRTVRTQEHILSPGMLVLARAGTIDSYFWDSRHPSSHAYVHFEVDSPGGRISELDWPLWRPMERNQPLGGLCSYLLSLAGMDDDAARARSDQIIGTLFDVFINGPLPSAAHSQMPERLLASVAFVRKTWDADGLRIISLEELAAAGRMSSGHCSRLFRQELGCGPIAALELVRLARTAIMLQRSNLSLAEISRLSGFSDQYHFSRRFSAAYGTSPGRYRQHIAQTDPPWPVTRPGLLPLWRALLSADG